MTGTLTDTTADPGADLARWVASGDRLALDRALALAADPAYAQAFRLLGRASDADDATQEALVQLVRSARRYDPARPFRPWLARLVHDACCRLLRSDRRRRRREAEVAAAPPPAGSAVDPDAVREAVLALPDGLRAAVELHYFAGLSQAEAAAALSIGEGACAMRLSRAREQLRGLLGRHAVAATPAIALALLATAPAHAAPPAIAAHVAALAATGTLPATTIPLTFVQTGAMFMSSHPLATATVAALLCAAAAAPFALHAGESTPPKPAPPAVAPVANAWSAPAKALLPYLDPKAAFSAAIDLQGLRPELLKTKPFSLLAEPKMAPLIAAWSTDLDALRMPPFIGWLQRSGLAKGRSLVCVLQDRTTAGGSEANLIMDLGDDTDLLWSRLSNAPETDTGGKPLSIGPFTGRMTDAATFMGRDGPRFVIASSAWLQGRLAKPPARQPSAPIWFHLDAGPLVASYVALSGRDSDPADVAQILGSKWRTMKPVIDGAVCIAKGEIVADMTASGAGPFSPLLPINLLLSGTGNASLPMGELRRPRVGIPASADRIAAFSLGMTLPADLLFTINTTLVRTGWSGDVACEVRPGAPLPKVAFVFGLNDGINGDQVVTQLAGLLGGEVDATAHPVQATTLIYGGILTLVAYHDRVVATFNADPGEWPGIGTTATPATTADCTAMIDLPAAARTWWPLLQMALPAEQRAALPPLQLLLPYLPVWRMEWTSTPDGCQVIEHGLPLITVLTAAAAVRIVSEADPEAETKPAPGPRRQAVPPPPASETF